MNSDHIFRVWSLQRTFGNEQENHLYVLHGNPPPLAPTHRPVSSGVQVSKLEKGYCLKGRTWVCLFIF